MLACIILDKIRIIKLRDIDQIQVFKIEINSL